jgi:hypothetical protein
VEEVVEVVKIEVRVVEVKVRVEVKVNLDGKQVLNTRCQMWRRIKNFKMLIINKNKKVLNKIIYW